MIYRNFILPRRIRRHQGFNFPPPRLNYWFPVIGHLFAVMANRDLSNLDRRIADMNARYKEMCVAKRNRLVSDPQAAMPDLDGAVKSDSVVRVDPAEFFEEFPGIQMEVVNQKFVLPMTPEDIKHVTQGNFQNYVMGELRVDVVSSFMGRGIFTSDDAFWLDQRNLARPSFHNLSLQRMLPTFHLHSLTLLEQVDHVAKRGMSLEMQDRFLCYTLDCSGEILFNHAIGSLHGNIPFQKAFDYLQVGS